MDPLSITASAITVLAAAGQAAKAIQRLRAIRKAPIELKLLLEEVTDLNDLLKQVESSSPTKKLNGNTELDLPEDGLGWQIQRTSSKLQELDLLIQEHAPRPTRFGIDRSHLGWQRGRQRANKLRDDLKVLRMNLAASVGAKTS